MAIKSSGCAAVDAMSRISIKGNVTPLSWYRYIKKENGRPDLLAAAILSDIVYWYRPIEVRDEATGYVIGLRKKFKADFLQKTYEAYANMFGENKRIVKESMDRLEKMGLIKKIFRDLILESGFKVRNVMFIEIFPKKIAEISAEEIDSLISTDKSQTENEEVFNVNKGGTLCRNTSFDETHDNLQNNGGCITNKTTDVDQSDVGHPSVKGVNTYNTSENTNIKDNSVCPVNYLNSTVDNSGTKKSLRLEIVKKSDNTTQKDRLTDKELTIKYLRNKVLYDDICEEVNFDPEKVNIMDGIINIIADIVITKNDYIKINKSNYPAEVVKDRFMKINYKIMTHVLWKFDKNTTKMGNTRSYILTVIYNSFDEISIVEQNEVNAALHRDGYI